MHFVCPKRERPDPGKNKTAGTILRIDVQKADRKQYQEAEGESGSRHDDAVGMDGFDALYGPVANVARRRVLFRPITAATAQQIRQLARLDG